MLINPNIIVDSCCKKLHHTADTHAFPRTSESIRASLPMGSPIRLGVSCPATTPYHTERQLLQKEIFVNFDSANRHLKASSAQTKGIKITTSPNHRRFWCERESDRDVEIFTSPTHPILIAIKEYAANAIITLIPILKVLRKGLSFAC